MLRLVTGTHDTTTDMVPIHALRRWTFIKSKGAVTGGQYQGSGPFGKGLCSSFSLPHCHHHGPQARLALSHGLRSIYSPCQALQYLLIKRSVVHF